MAFKDKLPSPTLYELYHHNPDIREEIKRTYKKQTGQRTARRHYLLSESKSLQQDCLQRPCTLGKTWGKLSSNTLLSEIKAKTR